MWRGAYIQRISRLSNRYRGASSSLLPSSESSYQWRQKDNEGSKQGKWSWKTAGKPLLGFSVMVTLKDFFNIDPVKLDNDPLKDKVKKSWLERKHRQYDKAVEILSEALHEAIDRKEELPITRVYDELANTYYEKGDLDQADEYFRLVINRLVHLHGKRDSDPEFIGISLKLADIYAQKGLLENSEKGYKHCVGKQMKVVEDNMKNFLVAQGALVEERHLVESHGAKYTDPLALFGMALEAYSHFLLTYCDESRMEESMEFIDEVLKISHQIYGSTSLHSITVINNYSVACIMKNRFKAALKYLELVIDRIIYIDECASMIPGFYCNYAEALWHTGRKDEALEWAQKAVHLSTREEPRIRDYATKFLKQLEDDHKRSQPRVGGKWWFW
uniref:TPR_REGION domain-containing protein n=1 Tax=Steinernema glaseri TaxID=37863 RepID=A0A1I7ZNJ1_9BILA